MVGGNAGRGQPRRLSDEARAILGRFRDAIVEEREAAPGRPANPKGALWITQEEKAGPADELADRGWIVFRANEGDLTKFQLTTPGKRAALAPDPDPPPP